MFRVDPFGDAADMAMDEMYFPDKQEQKSRAPDLHCNSPLVYDELELMVEVLNKARKTDYDWKCSDPPMLKNGRVPYTSGLILGKLLHESQYIHIDEIVVDNCCRAAFYTAPTAMEELFDTLVSPKAATYQTEVDAFALGSRAGLDIATSTLRGLASTTMKDFTAAHTVFDELEGIELSMHYRTIQYAKSGALLTYIIDQMDSLVPLEPIQQPHDVKAQVYDRLKKPCHAHEILFKDVGPGERIMFAYWTTRDYMVLRISVPPRLRPETADGSIPVPFQKCFAVSRMALLAARDVTRMRRNVFQSCHTENLMRAQQLPATECLENVLTSYDTLLSTFGESAYDAIDLHEPLALSSFFKKYEVLRAHNDAFREEIRKNFKNALMSVAPNATPEVVDSCLDRINESLDACRSPTEFCEVFGLNRIWGYSVVKERASFEKCRVLMTDNPELDEMGKLWALRIRGAAIRKFCSAYLRKHSRLPQLDASKPPPPSQLLRRWFAQGNPEMNPKSHSSPTDDEWSFVELKWHLLFDDILDPAALLDDKAISLPRDEIGAFYRAPILGARVPQLKSRRLLLELWSNPKMSMTRIIELVSDLSVPDKLLVYAMVSKEKCTNLIGRLFTYTTPHVRAFYSTLERNIKDSIFPFTPSQTMTMTEVQLHKRLMKVRAKRRGKNRTWVVQVSLDFKKWCQHFTVENTEGITDFLDAIFGFKARDLHVYRHAQKLGGMCLFFLGSKTAPPPELVLNDKERQLPHAERLKTFYAKFKAYIQKLLKGSSEGDLAFFSTGRLGEGTLQKLWTLISVHIAEAVAYLEKISVELIGQGDNQVLEIEFPIPDDCPENFEYLPPFVDELEHRVESFMKRLNDATSALKLPLKEKETWASLVLKIYGKRWVCGGAIMSQVLKRIARASGDSNAIVAETAQVVSMAAATGLSASSASTSFVTPYLISAAAVCSEYIRDLMRSTASITLAHACPSGSRAVFKGTADEYMKVFKPAYGIAKKQNKWLGASSLASLLRFVLLFPTVLGGLPIAPLARFFMRKWPDPLTETGVSLKMAAAGGLTEAAKLYKAFSKDNVLWLLVSPHLERNCEAVVRNPDSIVIDEIQDPERHVKSATREGLAAVECRNVDYQPLLDPRLAQEDEKNAKVLASLIPFSPRVASELWSLTAPAVAEMCLSSFDSPSTFGQITKSYKSLAENVCATSLSNSRFRLQMLASALIVGVDDNLECVTDWAQALRVRCYGPTVDGITTPHPWEQCTYRTAQPHEPYPDEHNNQVPFAIVQVDPSSRVTMDRTRAFKTEEGLMLAHARGSRDPYMGSETSRWTTQQSIKVRKTDRPVRDALRACVDAQWFTEPDSNLRRFIDYGIVRSRTGITLNEGMVHSGMNQCGCTTHRLRDTRSDHGAELNALATFTTCMSLITTNLTLICRSRLQWVMVLQAWAVSCMAMEIYAAASVPLRDGGDRYNVFITLNCGSDGGVLPKVSTKCCLAGFCGTFEIGRKGKYTRTAYKKSRLLYASASDLKSMYISPTTVPAGTCIELPYDGIAPRVVAVAAAGSRMYECCRYLDDVAGSSLQNVNRTPPPLRLRDFAALSLTGVIEQHAFRHLLANMPYVVRKCARVSQMSAQTILLGRSFNDLAYHPYLALVTIPGKKEEFDRHVVKCAKSSGLSVQHTSVAQTLRDMMTHSIALWMKAISQGSRINHPIIAFYQQGSKPIALSADLASHVFLTAAPVLRQEENPMLLGVMANIWVELRAAFHTQLLESSVEDPREGMEEEGFLKAITTVHTASKDGARFVEAYITQRRLGLCQPMYVVHSQPEYSISMTQHGDDEDEVLGFVGEIVAAEEEVDGTHPDMPEMKPLTFSHAAMQEFQEMPSIESGPVRHLLIDTSLGTNVGRGRRAEVVVKRAGSYSTANHKFLYILARLGLRPRYVLCLAEGLGGTAALFTRLDTVVGIVYQTLDPGIVDGCQDGWYPACVLAEGCPSKLLGRRQAMVGATDLRAAETVTHISNLAVRVQADREHELGVKKDDIQEGYDVITCDIFCDATTDMMVWQCYTLGRNVGDIAHRCLHPGGVAIMKCFSSVHLEFTATLCGLAVHFTQLSVLTNPFSGHENAEQYVICRGPRPGVGTMASTADGSLEVETTVSDKELQKVLAEVSRERRLTRRIRPAMEKNACLEVCKYLSSKEYGARVRGHSTVATLFSLPLVIVPEPGHVWEEGHRKKRREAREKLIHILFGVLEAARELVQDVNHGLRVAEDLAPGFASAGLQRSMKYGRRRVEVPQSHSQRACLAALLMKLLTENPQTPAEYEKVIEENIRLDVMVEPRLDWKANITEAEFGYFGRSVAQIYGAYGDYRLKKWLSDDRGGTALFAAGGVRGYSDFDNVRHTGSAASHLAYLLCHIIKCGYHDTMFDLFGGRGSVMESLVQLVPTPPPLKRLVINTNRRKEYSRQARKHLYRVAEKAELVYGLSQVDTLLEARQCKALVFADLVWSDSHLVHGQTFRNLIRNLVGDGCTVCYTAGVGHHGYDLPNTHQCVRIASGRSFVCVGPRPIEMPSRVYVQQTKV